MKKLIFTFLFLGSFCTAWTCSCGGYEPNFFKNIKQKNFTCLVVYDSTEVVLVDSIDMHYVLVGHARVISVYGQNKASEVGSRIKIIGENGINCNQPLFFNKNDILFMSLEESDFNTYDLKGLCGLHYLKLINGCANGLCFEDIVLKINKMLSKNDPRCECFPSSTAFSFFMNIRPKNTYILAKYHRFDYNYNHKGLVTQTGYFTLIDSINPYGQHLQDTIIVLGEDGISCGEFLHEFNQVDTMFLSLNPGYYRPFAHDTFYLEGQTCSKSFAIVKNGIADGRTISQAKDLIYPRLISSNEMISDSEEISIFPNPATDDVNILSIEKPIQRIECLNGIGQKFLDKKCDDTDVKIDIGILPPGSYLIKVWIEGRFVVKPFIKM